MVEDWGVEEEEGEVWVESVAHFGVLVGEDVGLGMVMLGNDKC